MYLDLALDDETTIRPGDVISGPKKRWRVVDAWPTDSAVWGNRWTLTVREDATAQLAIGRIVIETTPYRQGETPQDAFGLAAADAGAADTDATTDPR